MLSLLIVLSQSLSAQQYKISVSNTADTVEHKDKSFILASPLLIGNGQLMKLEQCSFMNCKNTGSNGACILFNGQNGKLSVKECTFIECSATAGSGIHMTVSPGTMEVIQSDFYNMTATDTSGGALTTGAGNVTITLSLFEYCHAGTIGGAIFFDHEAGSCWLSITKVTATYCDAVERGGTIAMRRGHLSLSESIIETSKAVLGGAIVTEYSSTCLFNSSTISTSVADYGGGIWTGNARSVVFENTHIYNCIAEKHGGGIACPDAVIIIRVSTTVFKWCEAKRKGGGICTYKSIDYTSFGISLELDATTFVTCRSESDTSGHGCYFYKVKSFNWTSLCISDCGESPICAWDGLGLSLPGGDDLTSYQEEYCKVENETKLTKFWKWLTGGLGIGGIVSSLALAVRMAWKEKIANQIVNGDEDDKKVSPQRWKPPRDKIPLDPLPVYTATESKKLDQKSRRDSDSEITWEKLHMRYRKIMEEFGGNIQSGEEEEKNDDIIDDNAAQQITPEASSDGDDKNVSPPPIRDMMENDPLQVCAACCGSTESHNSDQPQTKQEKMTEESNIQSGEEEEKNNDNAA